MDTTKTCERDAEPAFWAVIPSDVLYDADLPASAKLLYAEISGLTRKRGFCFAGNEHFVKSLDLSERTVQRHLNALAERGYIRIMDGDGGAGRRRIYAGLNPLLMGNPDKNDGVKENPDKNDAQPRQKCRGNPDKNGGENNTENNTGNIPPKAPQGARRVKQSAEWEPELFERFWEAYPRHEDKAGARREWDRLRPDRELMMVMSAVLKRAKSSDEWRRGIGIPYACRWLSHRRWEDGTKETADGPGPGEEALPWIV